MSHNTISVLNGETVNLRNRQVVHELHHSIAYGSGENVPDLLDHLPQKNEGFFYIFGPLDHEKPLDVLGLAIAYHRTEIINYLLDKYDIIPTEEHKELAGKVEALYKNRADLTLKRPLKAPENKYTHLHVA